MLECIFMAASTLSEEERDAMQTVAGEALRKLEKARDLLDAYRAAV
jgi:hypothetical protein